MSKLRVLLLLAMLAVTGTYAQNIQGIYLNGTSTWLGDTARENQILRYARAMNFNGLTLYDLNFPWNVVQKNKLAAFIRKAKTVYNIQQVGAAGETYSFFAGKVIPYNNSRSLPSERFDVMNFEFEFWLLSSISASYSSNYLAPNGYASDTAGAFAFAWKQFRRIDSLCAANSLISEIYLGWPNQGQMQKIASIADRILIHSYRVSDADLYQYTRPRLQDIASTGRTVTVMPIFSSEPLFMQNWLATNPLSRPYQTYSSDYNSDTASFRQFINLEGQQWFVYSTMPATNAAAFITANGPVAFCNGGSVVLTSNPGQSYLWSPGGATTRSITVIAGGSYTVQVTDTAGVISTSAPVTVTITPGAVTPAITASGSLKICQGGSVMLTSSLAGSYAWSNGATTQSIMANTAGNYSVTATSGGCTATSAPVTVVVKAPPAVPVVTANGSLSVCPGEPVTLTANVNDGYLWSTGATTRSIVVNAAGNYTVRVYNAPFCYNTSAPASVTQLASPPVPVVSITGLTILTPGRPTTTLSSSISNGYLWSTGDTTRSVEINTQGSYRVIVTAANGCKAVSQPVIISANGCTPPPVPVITATGSVNLQPGDSVSLFSSVAGGYLWSEGSTSRSINVTTPGTYTVRAYNGPACFATSLPVTVRMLPARMKAAEVTPSPVAVAADVNFYPNPAKNEVHISFVAQQAETYLFRMTDCSGRTVAEQVFESSPGINSKTMDISELHAGIYFSQLVSGEYQIMKNISVVK